MDRHWQVRHGGLLGVKYLVAVRADLVASLLDALLPGAPCILLVCGPEHVLRILLVGGTDHVQSKWCCPGVSCILLVCGCAGDLCRTMNDRCNELSGMLFAFSDELVESLYLATLLYDSCVDPHMGVVITAGLEDASDDVRAAAADALLPISDQVLQTASRALGPMFERLPSVCVCV